MSVGVFVEGSVGVSIGVSIGVSVVESIAGFAGDSTQPAHLIVRHWKTDAT